MLKLDLGTIKNGSAASDLPPEGPKKKSWADLCNGSCFFNSMGIDASAEHSGLRTQNSGLRTQDSGFRTQNSELRTQDSGLRTQDSGLRAQDSGLRTQNSELKTQDSGLRTHNSGLRSVRLFTREGFYVTCNVRDADQDGGAAA